MWNLKVNIIKFDHKLREKLLSFTLYRILLQAVKMLSVLESAEKLQVELRPQTQERIFDKTVLFLLVQFICESLIAT